MPKAHFFAFLLALLYACQHDAPRERNAQQSVAASKEAAPAPAEEQRAGSSMEPEQKDAALYDAINPFGTVVAVASTLDSVHQFIRTAELKFQVRDVLSTTLHLEDLALHNHGFVTVSNITTEVEYRDVAPSSRDSAVETTRFSLHGHLTLRVPYRQLDTTLRAMYVWVDFLDYRRVSAEDVALKMLETELLQRRQGLYQQDVHTSTQAAVANTKLAAADRLLNSRTAADQNRIERLKLEEAVQYSTVDVEIYQPAQIRQQNVANTEIKPVGPGFWAEIGDGLRSGAALLASIIIGLVYIWSLILLGVAVYFLGKMYWKKRKV